MIPVREILQPKSVDEICRLLKSNNGDTRIIAGGTDIIPGFHIDSPRFAGIKRLLDLQLIDELKTVSINHQIISIGAAITFSDIITNPVLNSHLPLLVKSSTTIGSTQIRNRATLGGNFINNAPCADSVAPLLVYDAEIKIKSFTSEKIMKLQDFLVKPYATRLNPDEILTKIMVPVPSTDFVGDFYKLGRRRAVSISRISLAMLMMNEDKIIKEMRIASGAVTPIGTRLYDVEEFAKGKVCNEEAFKEIAIKLGERILAVSGLRWSSEYKIPVVQQVCYQLLKKIER
ncbi:MAG: FAD binding domain-containing protein [Melioribacteraceae bacterium]|nr:FAD binding domain-containing protein [Melioribacteraceae bacterium]